MREIIPKKLWIGNARDAENPKQLLDLGIEAVLSLALEELPVALPRDLIYCRFPLIDGEGNSPELLRGAIMVASHFISADMPMLVSCGGGMSRSPAVVAAAISRIENISPEEALKQVTSTGSHDLSTSLWEEIKHAI